MLNQATTSRDGIVAAGDACGDPVRPHHVVRPAPLPITGPAAAANPGGRRAASLALRLDRDGEHFVVAVLDAAGADLVVLAGIDEDDVVAVWRTLGATAGLPLAILDGNGVAEHAEVQIGRLKLGESRARRRGSALSGRRPRFLVRRKTGRLPISPRVHRGEPEIAPGTGAE